MFTYILFIQMNKRICFTAVWIYFVVPFLCVYVRCWLIIIQIGENILFSSQFILNNIFDVCSSCTNLNGDCGYFAFKLIQGQRTHQGKTKQSQPYNLLVYRLLKKVSWSICVLCVLCAYGETGRTNLTKSIVKCCCSIDIKCRNLNKWIKGDSFVSFNWFYSFRMSWGCRGVFCRYEWWQFFGG